MGILKKYCSAKKTSRESSEALVAISEDYKDKNLMVNILKSVIFMADLMRKSAFPAALIFWRFPVTAQVQNVRRRQIIKDLDINLEG